MRCWFYLFQCRVELEMGRATPKWDPPTFFFGARKGVHRRYSVNNKIFLMMENGTVDRGDEVPNVLSFLISRIQTISIPLQTGHPTIICDSLTTVWPNWVICSETDGEVWTDVIRKDETSSSKFFANNRDSLFRILWGLIRGIDDLHDWVAVWRRLFAMDFYILIATGFENRNFGVDGVGQCTIWLKRK